MTVFLRDGRWCECERSCNASNGALEDGVSVYECDGGGNGLWKPRGNAWAKNGEDRIRDLDAIWLLVQGTAQSTLGQDREPLLKGVTVLKRLVWDASAEAFAESGAIVQQFRHHSKFPRCVCEGGIEFLRSLTDSMYGNPEEDEDETDEGKALIRTCNPLAPPGPVVEVPDTLRCTKAHPLNELSHLTEILGVGLRVYDGNDDLWSEPIVTLAECAPGDKVFADYGIDVSSPHIWPLVEVMAEDNAQRSG